MVLEVGQVQRGVLAKPKPFSVDPSPSKAPFVASLLGPHHVAHSNQVSKEKALMGTSGARVKFCLNPRAKLSLMLRVKAGPGPFVLG